MSLSPAAKKTTIGATAVAIAMGERWRGGASEGGRGGREREQVIVEEAAFEIFIPCRLMALSAVDRMELGKRGKKEGREREDGGRRRKFSCEWAPRRAVPWCAVARERPEYILEGGHKRPLQ